MSRPSGGPAFRWSSAFVLVENASVDQFVLASCSVHRTDLPSPAERGGYSARRLGSFNWNNRARASSSPWGMPWRDSSRAIPAAGATACSASDRTNGGSRPAPRSSRSGQPVEQPPHFFLFRLLPPLLELPDHRAGGAVIHFAHETLRLLFDDPHGGRQFPVAQPRGSAGRPPASRRSSTDIRRAGRRWPARNRAARPGPASTAAAAHAPPRPADTTPA